MSTQTETSNVHRWCIYLYDPLIPAKEQRQITKDIQEWMASSPAKSAAWVAGVCWMVGNTLPSIDPWRHLAAYDASTGLRLGDGPDHTGAVVDTGVKKVAFGTVESGEDLVEPTGLDTRQDIWLATLSQRLTDQEAAAFAFCIHEWRTGMQAILAIDIADRYEACLNLMRWVLWRRRYYNGMDDPYLLMIGTGWLLRLDEDGQTTPEGEGWAEDLIESELIEDYGYTPTHLALHNLKQQLLDDPDMGF